jgi:hypothetical protein
VRQILKAKPLADKFTARNGILFDGIRCNVFISGRIFAGYSREFLQISPLKVPIYLQDERVPAETVIDVVPEISGRRYSSSENINY